VTTPEPHNENLLLLPSCCRQGDIARDTRGWLELTGVRRPSGQRVAL